MMALDFFSTSSSVMAGFGGGGVGAFSRLTAGTKNTPSSQHPAIESFEGFPFLQPVTCELFAGPSVPAAPVPAAPVPVISHAGHATHGLVPAVSPPAATVLRLSAKAPLGESGLAAPVISALPPLVAIKAVEAIPVAPVALTTGARSRSGRGAYYSQRWTYLPPHCCHFLPDDDRSCGYL